MQNNYVIKLSRVSKTFKIRKINSYSIRELLLNHSIYKSDSKQTLKALSNIDLEINQGETFGVIGRNGSGKTTLLNIIMESIAPDKGGIVETKGRILRLSLGIGIDPNLSARDNIYVNGSLIGLTFDKIGEIFDAIINFADLNNFIDTPVKFFSRGMKQRLLFSIAMYAEADIFLLDEFFGGTGDQNFREKSDRAFTKKILAGKTIVVVSHNMNIIKKYCENVIWLENGEIRDSGKASEVINSYNRHVKIPNDIQNP